MNTPSRIQVFARLFGVALVVFGLSSRASAQDKAAANAGKNEKYVGSLFEKYDKNRDGKLQEDEWKTIAGKMIKDAAKGANNEITRDALLFALNNPGVRPPGDAGKSADASSTSKDDGAGDKRDAGRKESEVGKTGDSPKSDSAASGGDKSNASH